MKLLRIKKQPLKIKKETTTSRRISDYNKYTTNIGGKKRSKNLKRKREGIEIWKKEIERKGRATISRSRPSGRN